MGWLEWLLGAALAIGGAILISEVLSYFLNKQGLISWLRDQRSKGKIPSNTIKAMVNNRDDHTIDASALDSSDTNLGNVKVTSNSGISSDIQSGTIVYLD